MGRFTKNFDAGKIDVSKMTPRILTDEEFEKKVGKHLASLSRQRNTKAVVEGLLNLAVTAAKAFGAGG